MLLALPVLMAACGGSTGASAAPTPSYTFTMTAQNGSGVSGTGQVYKEVGAFKVSVELNGLVPNSSHVSHVHLGSCASQGAIAFALLEVVANSAGQATATSTVAEDYALARTGWYVNVHFGPDLSDAEYAPSIACGDLPPA
jgi:CHRD domain